MVITTLPALSKTVEHEDILSVRYGGLWQQDQYLSPLLYEGMSVGLENEWRQPFKIQQDSLSGWQHQGKLGIWGGWMKNRPLTNRMYTIGLQAGWGAQYKWKMGSGWGIYLGPYVQLDGGGRYMVSEVNKPANIELQFNVEAKAGVEYVLRKSRTSYRFSYEVEANMIGIDFMTDYWQSYYELSEGIRGRIRCAGMWNHRYMQQQLAVDMQFAHSTWRVGIRHEYLEYGESDLWISREQVGVVVGTCFHYQIVGNKSLKR